MQHRRSALVAGSTSGIGLAIADELAARGMNLVLNGFGDATEIESLRQSLATKHGVDVLYDGADMSQPTAIESMIANAMGRLGGLDVLVNNAGIQHVAPVDEFPVDKWNAILAINLTAAFHTTRLSLPYMKSRAWDRFIPHVDGTPAIARLVAYELTDIQVQGAWSGPARLHLVPHVNAPVADLPVRRGVGGLHFIADLTLPYGGVLHDYLAD